MEMIKITSGYVKQIFDGTEWVFQEFVAVESPIWEDENGEVIQEPPNTYLAFEMVQPSQMDN
jgi:hypothetical protein